ncbi:MAG: 30S ribosomal protein S20 [Gemmatimonadota bacterium]
MPNIKSAKKRLRQSFKRRAHNRTIRSEIRTRTRKLFGMTSATEAEPVLRRLTSLLDRAARKRIMHPNAAARQKSRFARYVRKLSD